jgi:hypothetical protein
LENVIIKFVADTSGLEPAIKQLELLGKISKDDAAAFAQVNNEQKEFIQNLNKSTTEMGKLSNEVDGLMAEIQAGVMEGFADHLAEVTKETKQAGGGFKSMKQELKELKAQISSGSLGEKELREATKRAAELTDTIGDVNDKVKALASDTKRIDAVVTAFRGIAAAASVAAGAASLFGSENEKLTKTLAQAQGAMALLQGVQELANIATTEGALRTMALDAAQKVATVSSRILGVTISASMVMATAGVSVLLAGLAYLITSTDDHAESVKLETEAIEKQQSVIKEQLDFNSKIANRKSELAKAEGKSQKEIYDIQRQGLVDEIKILDAKIDAQKVNTEEQRKENNRLTDLRVDTNQKLLILDLEYAKSVSDADKKAADEKLKKVKEAYAAEAKALQDWRDKRQQMMEEMKQASIDMEMAEVEGKINARKKDDADFDQQILDRMDKQKAANDLELERLKALMSETTAVRKMSTEEYTQFAIEQATVLSNTIFTINQQNRQAETNDILESLAMRKDAELANKNLTDAQRLQIEERYAQQEAQIKQRAWEAQKQADLAQAIINTALAVTKAFATVPPPANIFAAAAAGVAGAAQIAIISSTQPPKFADGGMVGGQLHSSGGTLIEAERGEYVINRQSTSEYLPSLKVLNSGEVEPTFANNILTALANGTFDLAAQFQTKQSASSDGINYDKLDRIMAKHKSNLNVNIDEQGLTTFLLKENSRVEFRNKKMRYRA